MSQRLKELRDKRGTLVAKGREILDKAAGEKRDLTNEENAKYEEIFAEQEKIGKTIKAEERQVEIERESAEKTAREKDQPDDPDKQPGEQRDWAKTIVDRRGRTPEYVRALAEVRGPIATPEYRQAFSAFLRNGKTAIGADHLRALQAGTDPEGGYIKAPPAFIAQLIKAVDDITWIRQVATQVPVNGADEIGVPSLDTDPDDADWTTELATGSEDSAMKFGKRAMEGHPLAKRIKVSRKLLRTSAIGAEALVMQRLAYKFGITLEKAYLTGNGVKRPLGLFTASTDGITTARDVSTGNATTALTFDGIIEAKYSVKSAYWGAARWLFHRTVVKDISKLKDGDNQYLWRPSVREGEPDMVLGHPLMVSEYTPNTMTTGQYFGLFGDFSKYWYLDSFNFEIQRLDELYAETAQVGFIGRYEGDGAPVLAEAFARLKLL